MIYLIAALDAEARPLIEHYRLRRDRSFPYTAYRGEHAMLLVTQPGKSNAMMATSALLGWRIPSDDDILINIGVCGAPESYPIAQTLLAHQIIDGSRRYYPDILYPHPFTETPLECVDLPADTPGNFPVDMESAGVFVAASKFFKLHRMAFLKIVSDHFRPENVTKEGVIELVGSRIGELDALAAAMYGTLVPARLFTIDEERRIEEWKELFTAAQGGRLDDALRYFRLRRPESPIPFPQVEIPASKRERSALLETFLAVLHA